MQNVEPLEQSGIWRLPDGVEERLPDTAWALEALRARLLARYRELGFELVVPPLVEHLGALLTGAGSKLGADMFKFTDPVSGKLLGLRADMTPQVARIAARQYRERNVLRLCYLGSVLRTRPDAPGGPRELVQVGCEVFGDTRLQADLEVLKLMVETLAMAGINDIHVGLGHAGVCQRLFERLALEPQTEAELFGILQRKSIPDFAAFCDACSMDDDNRACLGALLDLHGSADVLEQARERLSTTDKGINEALDALAEVVRELSQNCPQLVLHVDLAELQGYRYHTGIVFSAFASGHGGELARGGRYDGAGREFGLARPATGFSADLNQLLHLGETLA